MIANNDDDDDGDDDKDYNMGDNPDDGDDDYGLRLMMMMTTTPMPQELSAMMTQTLSPLRDNNDGRHHQLMVLRFRSTLTGLGDDSSFSMAACLCNAIQEPGIVNNSSMPLFGNPHK